MQKIIITIIFFLATQVLAYSQCSKRYKERVFHTVQKFEDVVYSKAAPALLVAALGAETIIDKDLKMDIYMPPVTDTVSKRPVVLLAHGGGFVNILFMEGTSLVGTMDNEDVQALADTLAHWGFVAASIEYRLGFDPLFTSSMKRAVWRGAQDMSAAVRFIRKNARWFDIDPNRIFIGGSSAGAFSAIHSTFVDDSERIPESYQLIPLLKKDLGAMHSRPIVALTGTNPFVGTSVLGNDVDSIAQGVVSYWGAIADTSWLYDGQNKAPMIMFHGDNDMVVDYWCAKPFSSVLLTAPESCGSFVMDSVMTLHNMPHELHTAYGEGHEYWGVRNGNWTSSGPNAYWPDMIDKTAAFFYDIMKPAVPLIVSVDTITPVTNTTFSVANPRAGYDYCWEVVGGVIVSQNTKGPVVDIQFYSTTTQAFVSVRAVDAADVLSDKQTKIIVVDPGVGVTTIPSPIVGVSLLPNPAADYCELEIYAQKEASASIAIYNTLGQLMLTQNKELQQGQNLLDLDIQNLLTGTYIVELRSENTRILKKLMLLK